MKRTHHYGKEKVAKVAKVAKKETPKKGIKKFEASSTESRDSILLQLREVLLTGGTFKGQTKHLVVGSNSIMIEIEKGNILAIGLARDSYNSLHQHVIEAATLKRIQFVVLSKAKEDLSKIFQLKSCTCFGITALCRNSGDESGLLEDNSTQQRNLLLHAKLDCLVEQISQASVIK
jgi:ribosomal protein L7Ae-like RNA K-turn-binding protein